MDNDAYIQEIKLCLLGDVGVGKSSIVLRFVKDHFNPGMESTIGASFLTKTIILDDTAVKFQIWDTAGQEKYHGLAPMYYRNAAAAVIVYDITRPETFERVKTWVKELRSQGSENTVIAIAGNKIDMESERAVSAKEAEAYAGEISAIFLETSAKTSENIHELFVRIDKSLPKAAHQTEPPAGIGLYMDDPPEHGDAKNDGCAC